MSIATPSPANDAALNEQLNITRDASIANLQQKSYEVQQQYRDEAAKIEDQKQRAAEVVQSNINSALDNAALRSEAEYNQAFKNLQTAEELAMRTSAANPRETRLPLELHRQVVESTQKFLSAQSDYVRTHPDKASDPAYNIQLAEDGNGGFQFVNGLDPGLAEQVTIASPDDARNMSMEDLRKAVQRPNRQTAPDEPLVKFIDQPDGTFDAQLITGETFRGFKANENRDAIRKIAESKVNTRRHYENLAQQQPVNGQQAQPQLQPQLQQQAQPQLPPGNDGNPPELSEWLAQQTLEGVAKQFGYANSAEFVADQNARYAREQENNALLEQYKNQNTVSQFFMEHPDYPNTDQANDALETIINRNGWEWTTDSMAAAHALAVQNRVYQPLRPEEIAVANGYAPQAHRPAPPPMLQGGNPDMSQPTAPDPQTMPLDQLRKMALAAQTGGR